MPTPPLVQIPAWKQFEWLRHGFTTRVGGFSTCYQDDPPDLNLGFTAHDDPALVSRNRDLVRQALAGPSAGPLIAIRQVHGTSVLTVQTEDGWTDHDGRGLHSADGLVTSIPGPILAVQAADCVPILVADTRQRVVAAFHAGWRGTVAAILPAGIAQMTAEFGSSPEDLVAAIGPAIGACCYVVGDEVRAGFQAAFPYAESLFSFALDGVRLNLAEANRRQLIASGLPAQSISVYSECTACTRVAGRRKYFSHRAEHGFTGRAMGLIAMAAPNRI